MINRVKGFTLIELMIVVAIIGIISAIAYPSYDKYMKRSRRADAKVGLSNIVDREERYYLQNNTYTTALDNTGLNLKNATSAASATSDEGYYRFTVAAPTPTSGYTAVAVAVAGMPQASDAGCLIMSLNSAGVKAPPGCW